MKKHNLFLKLANIIYKLYQIKLKKLIVFIKNFMILKYILKNSFKKEYKFMIIGKNGNLLNRNIKKNKIIFGNIFMKLKLKLHY